MSYKDIDKNSSRNDRQDRHCMMIATSLFACIWDIFLIPWTTATTAIEAKIAYKLFQTSQSFLAVMEPKSGVLLQKKFFFLSVYLNSSYQISCYVFRRWIQVIHTPEKCSCSQQILPFKNRDPKHFSQMLKK